MRTLRITATLAVAFLVGCVATAGGITQQGEALGSRPYYLTQTARTFQDSTASAIILHVDDRLMVWLGGMLAGSRRAMIEPAACLRIAKRRDNEFWVDSMTVPVDFREATDTSVVFGCYENQIPLHGHVYEDDLRCTPSDHDTSPEWSNYPAEALVCGVTIDSVVAWRAKPKGHRR